MKDISPSTAIDAFISSSQLVLHSSVLCHAMIFDKWCGMQSQSPAYVATKMSKQQPSLDAPAPETYVAAAVRHIGYESNAVPYFKHAMNRCVCSCARLRIVQYSREATL